MKDEESQIIYEKENINPNRKSTLIIVWIFLLVMITFVTFSTKSIYVPSKCKVIFSNVREITSKICEERYNLPTCQEMRVFLLYQYSSLFHEAEIKSYSLTPFPLSEIPVVSENFSIDCYFSKKSWQDVRLHPESFLHRIFFNPINIGLFICTIIFTIYRLLHKNQIKKYQ